jgi:hypothetical protein
MRPTQKSWWLAVLLGGLAATAVVIVRAAPRPSKVYPNGLVIEKGGGGIPASGTTFAVTVYCSNSWLPLSGGYDFDVPGAATAIESHPFSRDLSSGVSNGWTVNFQSNGGSGTAWVYAICGGPDCVVDIRSRYTVC